MTTPNYIFQITRRWYERVTRFVFGFHSGTGIDIHNLDGEGPYVSLNEAYVKSLVSPSFDIPENVASIESGVSEFEVDECRTDEWTAGNGEDDECRKMMVLTRTTNDGADGYLFFRELTISKDGRILKIGEETQSSYYITALDTERQTEGQT